MTEILFTLIIILFGVYHAWYVREKNKEVSKLVNALVSRTPEQFRDLELTDKVKPIETPAHKEPDFIPEEDMSDDKFKEMIDREMD